MHTLLLQSAGLSIQLANLLDLLHELQLVSYPGPQPVAALMWFKIGLTLKNARPNGLKCARRCRA
jgi:hypothetical protein